MKKLILIDGYSFLFRAFFAIRGLTRQDGTPVNGLYGFSRMLIKIITEIEYSHIAVAFDAGGKTFRNEIYKEYKANRPPCPPELIPQFPLVRDLVKSLNIVSLEKKGFEADDIIATFAKKAELEGFEVVIVSSDKDLMQLVDDKVVMFDGMKGEYVGVEKVKEKWGVEPKKVLDVLSLMGDSSDNVPGVAGIGPKTASELINEYGDIDNLLKNLDKIKQNKRRESLISGVDNILLSKKLITLDENVETDFTLSDLEFKQYDYRKFLEFLTDQEFYSMVKGLKKAFATIDPSLLDNENIVVQDDLFIETRNDDEAFIDKKIGEEVAENITIKNVKDLQNIINQNKNIDKFYFNILMKNANILSFSFKFNSNVDTFFVKVLDSNGDLFNNAESGVSLKDILENFKEIFENDSILKVGYDVKKQIKVLYSFGVSLNNFEDIEVMNYVLHNGLYNNLMSSIIKNNISIISASDKYFKQDFDKEIENIINIEKDYKVSISVHEIFKTSIFLIDAISFFYAALKEWLELNNELKSVYEKIEKPITAILANMEITGIKLDINRLSELSKEFQIKIDDLSKEVYEIAGEEFNIGSPKQLAEVLFEKMKLQPLKKSSKSGNFSTDVETLEELAQNGCDICKKILDWRHYSKLKNTYTDVLQTMVDKNNRIHTTYSNTYVITGRLSSSNPNLQNIPIKTEEGNKIRSAFIAKDGCKLVAADYKQAELRVIANLHNIKKLKEAFKEGKDIHTNTASKVFKVEESDVSSAMRGVAKAINFGIIYGISQFGLAKRINTTSKEAKEYLNNYFEVYPEVKDYIEQTKKFVKENSYVATMFGRKINIDLNSVKPMLRGNLERLAINAPIQGTASDITKKAMISLNEKLKNYRSKMILQIHDELVLECPNEEVEEISKLLKETMEDIINWEVKMEVDVEVGSNLGEI